MTSLADKKCLPCEGNPTPLSQEQKSELLKEVNGWQLREDGKELKKCIKTNSFIKGVELIKALTPIAEEEGHHPDIELTYPTLTIRISTHSAGDITEADFVLAAKIDRLENSTD